MITLKIIVNKLSRCLKNMNIDSKNHDRKKIVIMIYQDFESILVREDNWKQNLVKQI